jgi:hypothetical protein
VLGLEGVRWFLGLTCDFWAKIANEKCKGNKQQQIPFGDDNQKGKGNGKVKTRGLAVFAEGDFEGVYGFSVADAFELAL